MKLTAESTVLDDKKIGDSFATLQVEADGIRTEVGTKVGNNEVISRINQTAETIKIQADKVNIEGATIFTSGRLSQSSLDGAYDASGSATSAVNGLKTDLSSSSGTTVINGGHIETGTLSASAVNASSGTFDTANIPDLNASKITAGYLSADRIESGSLAVGKIDATSGTFDTANIPNLSAEKITTGTLDANRIGATSISIGKLDTSTQNTIDKAYKQSVEYIAGTQTAATNVWTGTTADASLVVGKTIAYYLPFAGNSSAATLNLTLSGGGTTGAKNVRWNNTNVTTHYPAGSVINMTYDGTYWKTSAYNSDTYNRTRYQAVLNASAAITALHIICGTASGYRDIAASVAFDLTYPLLYAATAIEAGATTGTRDNNYSEINGIAFSNNGTITSGGANKTIYLKGTVSGKTFTISASPFLTTVAPTSADGFVYIPLGIMTSATNGYFRSSQDIWAYQNGIFQKVDSVSNYITDIDTKKGITIKPSDSSGNDYLQMNSTDIRFVRNNVDVMNLTDSDFRTGTASSGHTTVKSDGLHVWTGVESTATNEVAFYGSTARVGKSNTRHIEIKDGGLQVYKDATTVMGHIGYGSGNSSDDVDGTGSSGTAEAPYYSLGTRASGAVGNYSLAQGTGCLASGPKSTATGQNTTASGNMSHAEGASTQATSYEAHAEGYLTVASGQMAHAEGKSTTASASWTHSEGLRTTASGWGAHAEGGDTQATKPTAHAEGNYTTASGSNAHAEGDHTEASGDHAHSEGFYTKATAENSHAEGYYAEANGKKSHAGGDHTKAQGECQTVIGKYNATDTTSLFIIGKGTSDSARANAFAVSNTGQVFVNGSSVHGSDRRLKEHISYVGDEAVEFIDGLKPAHYIKDGEKHVGFYAQDVAEVDKWDCMIGEEMNGYMTLGYMELIAPMVAYIQRLEKRIEELERSK